jgi:L-fuconate dehydratase
MPSRGAGPASGRMTGLPREVIIGFETHDVRFPTALTKQGSDAMNPEPDYSAAYLIIRTDSEQSGHGLVFTIGTGNDVEICAIRALEPYLVGRRLHELLGDLGAVYRELTHASPLRWLGPEKGAMHMAIGAVINALWDLRARAEGRPVWRLLSELTPEELVDLVDFRYLEDQLTREEGLEILRRRLLHREERVAQVLDRGLPAYTTSAGWIGYSDEELTAGCQRALSQGFRHVKIKVGAGDRSDARRCDLARSVLRDRARLMVDANQAWGVEEAVDSILGLARFDPYWVEEPTSPDDILGTAQIAREVAPIRIAGGEHVANRVVFKQLLASSAIAVCQIDACRVAGINENLAILLLAAKFGVPVCPHAGGVGLSEMVSHLAAFDYVACGGPNSDRLVEWVDDLHQHFEDPARVIEGSYRVSERPGFSTKMHSESLAQYAYPDGPVWRELR